MKKSLSSWLFLFSSVVLFVLCNSMSVYAQSNEPTLSDHIARLSIRASQLLPYLQNEVLSHIQDWVHGIAVAVAVVVLLLVFFDYGVRTLAATTTCCSSSYVPFSSSG